MLGAWSHRALAALLCVAALPARAQTVKVGAALSMTGAAAVYGASHKKGIELAAEEINKSGALKNIKLQVMVEDDGSTKEQGINVYQRFINRERVAAILGPTLSTTATAANPIAQGAKVPVIAISNTAPKGITDIGDYIWRISLTEAQVIPGAMKKAQQKLGFKSAAVLYGNDDVFTKAGYDVMKRSLDELKNLNPDIIVVSALADNASAIVSQARQLGYKGPIMGGNGFNSPAFIKNAGPAAEGVLVGTAWDSSSQAPENQKFIQAMQAKGDNPDQFTAQAYTAVYVLAEAIKRAGNKTGRGDIKAGLAKVKDLSTPLGKLSFTPERDGQHPPALQQVKDGKFAIVQ